jgi:thiamine pyrophosphokinase
MGNGEVTRFRPGWFLAGGDVHNGATADMLILNQPIASFEVFAQLWRHVRFCLCVDGGANRLYDMFEGALEARRAEYVRTQKHQALAKADCFAASRLYSW